MSNVTTWNLCSLVIIGGLPEVALNSCTALSAVFIALLTIVAIHDCFPHDVEKNIKFQASAV